LIAAPLSSLAEAPEAELNDYPPLVGLSPVRLRTMLVCSSGGHLLQLYQLKPWWERHDRVWVTFRKPDAVSLLAGEQVSWAYHPTTRNIKNAAWNLRLAWKALRRYRPDVIISSGAGVALPFFLTAKLMGIRSIYLEVYDRIDGPTLTGRLCYPITDLFLLQWEQQRRFYPRGQVIGRLF
jgi:UDP-N-acetylglucosamine:LPS N-acetylglucosamine transferase